MKKVWQITRYDWSMTSGHALIHNTMQIQNFFFLHFSGCENIRSSSVLFTDQKICNFYACTPEMNNATLIFWTKNHDYDFAEYGQGRRHWGMGGTNPPTPLD